MIPALINILILLIVFAVLWYAVRLLATHFGLPPTIVQVIGVLLALILLLIVLREFAPALGWRGLG